MAKLRSDPPITWPLLGGHEEGRHRLDHHLFLDMSIGIGVVRVDAGREGSQGPRPKRRPTINTTPPPSSSTLLAARDLMVLSFLSSLNTYDGFWKPSPLQSLRTFGSSLPLPKARLVSRRAASDVSGGSVSWVNGVTIEHITSIQLQPRPRAELSLFPS